MNDISEMKRAGLSVSKIKLLTGFDRKTIRKYVETVGIPSYGPRAPRPKRIERFRPYIDKRLSEGVWNAAVLLRELKEQGYAGGYTSVKDYLQPLRTEADRVAVRRFETPPGRQAQLDWGDLGVLLHPDGTRQSISGFVMTLGHSRAMFADVSLDQKEATLLRMHERAFAELGGVPREILYDNMKTVVRETLTDGVDERGEIRWNPAFLDFARYYGFTPRLCRPYRPQTKGKVESGVKYVRSNFLCGRKADDLEDMRKQLHAWVAGIANLRTHGTTHRIVQDAWREEKPFLQDVSTRPPYAFQQEAVRRVAMDAYVSFRTNRYAAPWQSAGKEVCVRLVGERLQITRDEALLVMHTLNSGRHQTIEDAALHAGMPYGPHRTHRKNKVLITPGAPVVEQRSLQVYADAAGDSQECAP